MKKTQSNALTLTVIQLSGVVSLPVLMAGYFVGTNYPLFTGLLQIVFANMMLCLAACTYVRVALQHKTITVGIAEKFFGAYGGLICGVGMLFIMLGWSVIQFHYMITASQALLELYFSSSHITLSSFSGVNFSVNMTSVFFGLIMIITASSGLLYDLPTYYYHAKSAKDARYSILALFVFFIPCVQIIGLVLARMQLVGDFATFSLNSCGLLFLIFSSFFSNCLNIYSSALIINKLSKFSYKKSLVVVSALSFFSGFHTIDDSLITLLEVMNILSEIMLCLILVYVAFNGVSFTDINPANAKHHTKIFFLVLILAVSIKYLPFSITNDFFINTAFLSLFFMSIYCFARKCLCA